MSGTNSVASRRAKGIALGATALVAAVGFVLPAAGSPTGFPDIRRYRPTVSVHQCERAGGWVEATRQGAAVCRGGLDDGDPVDIT
jgi:hypothetical protein